MKTIEQLRVHRVAFLTFVLEVCAAASIAAGQGIPLPPVGGQEPVPPVVGQPVAGQGIPVPPVVGPPVAGEPAFVPPIVGAPIAYPAPGEGLGPAAPCPICAVDGSCCRVCGPCGRDRQPCWEDARFIAWQAYAQGEYVGHARTAHVPEYRLRVDDQLDMLYRITRDETARAVQAQRGRRLAR